MELKKHMTGSNNKTKYSNFIFYKLHHAGLINRLYSLQCAIGISHIMNRQLVLYNLKDRNGKYLDDPSVHYIKNYNLSYGAKSNIINNIEYTKFFDLIDYDEEKIFDKINYYTISKFYDNEYTYTHPLHNSFITVSETSEDKTLFNAFEIDLTKDEPYHFKGDNLSNYSTLFLNRTKELDIALSSTMFKKEYHEFAELVSKSLGKYNCIHVRLTDHKHNFNVTENNLIDAIENLNNLPIIVCTDEPEHEMFKNKNIKLIDDIIVNNFSKEFKDLSINSEIVFGLVSLLIASKSQDFIGTYFSTFTSYIHRQHYQRDIIKPAKFLGRSDLSESGSPWSWVGIGKQGIARDWPESRLMI